MFALLVLAVSGLSVAGTGEIILRLVSPHSDSVKLGLRLLGSERKFGLKPNVKCVKTGVEVRTNGLGFRERTYSREKPQGIKRVVVLGDSYTFGTGVQFEETFAKRLEAGLNRKHRSYEVINFGVSDYNTAHELATFREVAAGFDPDIVILAVVLNDAREAVNATNTTTEAKSDRNAWSIRRSLNNCHERLKAASYFYSFLSPKLGALLGRFGQRYAVGVTNDILRSYEPSSVGWKQSREAMVSLATETRAVGARLLVCVFPMMIDFETYPLKGVHEQILRFCGSNGIESLDLLPAFDGKNVVEYRVFGDGHPNGRAHAIFADQILSRLSGMLEPDISRAR